MDLGFSRQSLIPTPRYRPKTGPPRPPWPGARSRGSARCAWYGSKTPFRLPRRHKERTWPRLPASKAAGRHRRKRDLPPSCSHWRSAEGPAPSSTFGPTARVYSNNPGSPARKRITPGNRGRRWWPIGQFLSAGSRPWSSLYVKGLNGRGTAGKARSSGLGRVRGGAGHELNNPLAVIVGLRQLLLARTDHPETTRSLRIIPARQGALIESFGTSFRGPTSSPKAAALSPGRSASSLPPRFSRGMYGPGHSCRQRDRGFLAGEHPRS